MGYVLIDGKRYYQDTVGNVTLDNVSQEEAERREQRNANSRPIRSSSSSGTSKYVQTTDHTRTTAANRSASWRVILILVGLVMLAGAFIYNRSHVSPAEKAISDYMGTVAGASEAMTEAITEAITENITENVTENIVQENVEADINVEEQTGYILPYSSERYLEAYEIEHCSHDEIQRMINEIYARHGREFHSQDNINYFCTLDWYVPVPGKTDEEIVREFNEFEKANVDLLSKYL